MKKLYSAEVAGKFVFIVDLEKVSEDNAHDEAYQYLSDETELDLNNVSEITDVDEIPSGWQYSKPLGADKENDDDCKSYFEAKEAANRITIGLEELGYELEETFSEDIRNLLKREL